MQKSPETQAPVVRQIMEALIEWVIYLATREGLEGLTIEEIEERLGKMTFDEAMYGLSMIRRAQRYTASGQSD